MTELVKTTLDHDSTDMLIEKWLKHRNNELDAYHEWFRDAHKRRPTHTLSHKQQIITWNKGEDFIPENLFCCTVDTSRLIPLDRTWTTHIYHHHSMLEHKLSMIPVVFTMLPELMILRGMHDTGCDEIYVIVTDLKRQEMDDVTEYFKLACRYGFRRTCKLSIERYLQYEHTHAIEPHACPPEVDALLPTNRSHAACNTLRKKTSFRHSLLPSNNILFSDILYGSLFHSRRGNYPTGCPNPCCMDDCELIQFPRCGVRSVAVLNIRTKHKRRRLVPRQMCNWINCDVIFSDKPSSSSSSDGNKENMTSNGKHVIGKFCSKCRLVKYCSPEHQKEDWEEHQRVCVEPGI